MSTHTVPQVTPTASAVFIGLNAGLITLRLYIDQKWGETVADIVLDEDTAAEIILNLADALRGTASYGALANVIIAEVA